MYTYETRGTLTHAIDADNVSLAQAYLEEDSMVQYIDEELEDFVESVDWELDDDGFNYKVVAVANKKLTKAQLKQLSEWVSGQNSDGLGEGFEQQEFAEHRIEVNWDEFDYEMCSFDWTSNDSEFTLVSKS